MAGVGESGAFAEIGRSPNAARLVCRSRSKKSSIGRKTTFQGVPIMQFFLNLRFNRVDSSGKALETMFHKKHTPLLFTAANMVPS
uniref:Uncharacterized protein n=1 Tax=Romanomermis culicivorax TaxID=13658 RepID=A0A915HGG0_ROMCU